jgi:hypothetical protein
MESFAGSTQIESVLQAVGELLAAEGHTIGIVIVGGAALNLLGVVERTTRDVDVLAFAVPSEGDRPTLVEPPEQLPDWLQRAIREVGRDAALISDWLNTGPALQWRQGLPPGLETRVEWRQFSALTVGIAGRYDLVFLKLYASADSTGPESVHYQDLLRLQPSGDELDKAAEWVRAQDASPDFARILEEVVSHARQDLS